MVAAVSSSGLGLFGSSRNVLGGAATHNDLTLGRGTDRIYVNAATGNLVIQSRDERLSALGLGLSLVRTYNSQGLFNDDNGDNWVLGVHQRVYGLTGTVNTAGSTIRKVLGDGSDLLYQYNATRARYESTEGDGAHDTLSYNPSSSEWTWTDGSARTTETYNSTGQLLNSRDADGNTVTYGYTGSLLTSISDASGQVTTLVYSGNNLSEVRVVSNSVTQTLTRYTYDTSNRLSSARVDLSPEDNSISDGLVYTSTYTYDGTSRRVASITQSDGSSVSFTYENVNGQFRVKTYTVANAAGPRTTTFTYTNYESAGAVYLQTDVQDALGLVTTYLHDSAGRLTRVLSPTVNGARLETRYGYDAEGNVILITEDPAGLNRQTAMTYDAQGNLLTTRDSLGNTTSRTYNANNQVLTETRYLVRDPDGAGSATASTPLTTRYVYDSENHLRFLISADGRTTEHRYNAVGQRVLTFKYTGAFYTAPQFAESDLANWATAQDLTRLERTEYTYDFRGNLSTTTLWNQTTTTGEGVVGGQVAGEAPAWTKPSIAHYFYDQRGQLLRTVEPEGVATTNDANDYTVAFTYDGLGRLLTETEWGARMGGARVNRSTVTSYDDANRRTTTTLGSGLVTTSVYSQTGELLSVTKGSSGELGSTTYKYDADGRLRMSTDPTGVRTFQFYDEVGRKAASVDGDGSLTEYVYDRAGQLIKTIEYAALINSSTLATLVDASGNPVDVPLSTLRTAASGNPTQDRITRMVYDAAGKLVFAITADGAVTQHIYDGAGRLIETAAYNNRINIERTVDEVLPGAVSVAAHANDRRTRLFYDNDDQLVGKLDAEGYLTEQVYGASGLLIREIAYANQTATTVRATGTFAELKSSAGTDNEISIDPERDAVTNYLYDGQRRVQASVDAEGYLTFRLYYDLNPEVTIILRYDQVVTWSDTATKASLRAQLLPTAVFDRTQYSYDGNLIATENHGRGTGDIRGGGHLYSAQYRFDLLGNMVLKWVAGDSPTPTRMYESRYDAQGRLTQELSPEGRELIFSSPAQTEDIWLRYGTQYSYDLAGRRISVTVRPDDTQTNTTLFYYDNDNRLRFQINPIGERIEYRYNALGQLTDEIHYTNRIATTGLTGGLLTSELITTLSANSSTGDARTIYTYTLTGQVASKRVLKTDNAAQDGLTTYSYNAFEETETTVSSIDATRTLRHDYSYDKRGLLTLTRWDAVTGGLNTSESRTYDAFGRLRTVTDARGNVVERHEYDRLGREIATTDASTSDRTVRTYDAFSRVLTVRDAANNATTYTYDDNLRKTTITTPEGITAVSTYNRFGESLTIVAGGNTTTYSYNLNGQITAISDSLGTLESRTYDRGGRLVTQTDAKGVVTRFTYDAANRVLTRTVDSATEGLALATSYTYDGKGLVTRVQEPNGRITETTYDKAGRITQVAVDPAGQNLRTVYEYDRQDHQITVTEAFGSAQPRRTQYAYDTLGRRIEEIRDPTALGGTLNLRTQYKYDANGNLTRRIDANGSSTWYIYNPDNQLTHTIDALGGVTLQTYDLEDHITGTRRFAGTVSTAGFGDVVTSLSISTSANDRVTQIVRDRDGREHFTIDSLGGVTEKTFDANGRFVRERHYANAIALGTYTSTSAVLAALSSAGNDPNAMGPRDRVTWMAYDVRGRMAFTVDGFGSVTEYTYDAAGQVIRERGYAIAVASGGTYSTSSAVLSALTSAGNNTSVVAANDRVTWSVYDAVGRLSFSVDSIGAVAEFSYDAVGNVVRERRYVNAIAKTGSYTTTSAILTALTTAGNNPSTASLSDRVTWNAFDAVGRMVFSVDSIGVVTEYSYDAVGNVTRERRYANAVFRTGTYTSVSAVLSALTTAGNSTSTLSSTDRVKWATFDSLGRSLFNVDGAGAVTQYTYDANGNVTSQRAFSTLRSLSLPTDLASLQSWAAGTQTTLDHFTRYFYDSLNRLRFTHGPERFMTERRYDDSAHTQTDIVYTAFVDLVQNATLDHLVSVATAISSTSDKLTITLFDLAGRVSRVTDAIGNYDEYSYDAVGNRIRHRTRKNAIWEYEYDAAGRLTREISPEVYVSSVAESGTSLSGAVMRVETAMTYDVFGNVRTRTEAANIAGQARTTTYTYDAMGRQIRTDFPAVGVYNAAAGDGALGVGGATVNRTETTEVLFTQTAYDVFGNAFRNRDVSGAYSYKVYDTLGRVQYEVDAGQFVTAYTYDTFGNALTTTRHANALTSALPTNSSTITASDVTGRLVANSNADRTITTFYDRLNRVVEVRQPAVHNYLTTAGTPGGTTLTAAATVLSEYDAFGQVTRMRELVSSSYADTYFYYDRRGLKTAQVDALRYLTVYAYDEAGNLTRQVEYSQAVNGTVSTSSFGTVVTTTPGANPGHAAGYDREVLFSYDKLNRKISEARVGVEYTTVSGGNTQTTVGNLVTTYGYDALGNQTRMTVNGANTYTYYDTLGSVVAVAEPQRDRGDGVLRTPLTQMWRDAHGNLVAQRSWADGATAVSEGSYSLSADSNRDRVMLMRVDSHGRTIQTFEWLNDTETTSRYASYDARGNVAKEWQRVTNGATAETIVTLYEYDVLGRQTAIKETQRYEGANTILATTRSSYNAFGEVTSKSVDGQSGIEIFDYDKAGRLWRTNSKDGVYKVYWYDLQGNTTAIITSRYSSQQLPGESVDLSGVANAGAANLTSTLREERVYDLMGRVIEQREPSFQLFSSVAPITSYMIQIIEGTVYLTFSDPDTTLIARAYIDGVERTVIAATPPNYVRRVNLDALGLAAGSTHTYKLTFERIGAEPMADTSGTFTYKPSATNPGEMTANFPPGVQATPTKKQTVDRWGNVLTTTQRIQEQTNGIEQIRNNTWKYRYNQFDQLLETIDPVTVYVSVDSSTSALTGGFGSVVSRNYYDLRGRVVATRDGRGNLNERRYNQAGQVTLERFADGQQKSYVYDIYGQQIQVTDQAGYRTRQGFDRAGRLIATAGEINSNAFGATNVSSVPGFNPGNLGIVVKEYTYDQASRRLTETTGAAMDDGVNRETRRYTYDLMGNVSSSIEPLGGIYVAQMRYDTHGNKVFHRDANGAQASWTYDYFGHLIGHVDFGGTTYSYTYDNHTWLLRSQTSSGGQNGGQLKNYDYDRAKHLISLNDIAANRLTQYTYDGAGRVYLHRSWVGGMVHEDTRTRYDEAGRIDLLRGRGFIVSYWYDLAGNRTQVGTQFATNSGQTQTGIYYRYDAMNRITISGGVSNANVVSAGSTGTELTYDARGMRVSATTGGKRSTYSYDGLGRLLQTRDDLNRVIEDRTYDLASRVTLMHSSTAEGSNWVTRTTPTQYDDNGRILRQDVLRQVNGGPQLFESESFYRDQYGGYDAVGNVLSSLNRIYDSNGVAWYSSSNVYTYRLSETYQEASHQVTNSAVFENGLTTNTYNLNGELTAFIDTKNGANNRYFANNAQGSALTAVKGNYGNDPSGAFRTAVGFQAAFNTANAGYYFFTAQGQQVGMVLQLDGALKANFDINYTPISPTYPASVPDSYVTQPGETLRSVATKLLGDGSLWYLLAQPNGLSDPDAVIPSGRTLSIPNQVISLANTANVFKPFSIREAIGDTTPYQPGIRVPMGMGPSMAPMMMMDENVESSARASARPMQTQTVTQTVAAPAPKKKKGCGILGIILVVVVAVVATVLTAGVAAGALGTAVTTGAGTATASSVGVVAAGTAVLSGSVAAGSIATGLAAAAIGGAVGSIASQAVGVLTGVQEKFSWGAVALGAVGAGVGAAVGAGIPGLRAVTQAASNVNKVLGSSINAAAGNALTQGVQIATGLQNGFRWQDVAAAAVSAPVSGFVGQKAGRLFGGSQYAAGSPYASVGKFASDVTGSVASSSIRAAFRGKFDAVNVLTDAFGTAIGNSIVGQMQRISDNRINTAAAKQQQQKLDEQLAEIEARRAEIEKANPGGSAYYDEFRKIAANDDDAFRLASSPEVTNAFGGMTELNKTLGNAAFERFGFRTDVKPEEWFELFQTLESESHQSGYWLPTEDGGSTPVYPGRTFGMRVLKGIGQLGDAIDKVKEEYQVDKLLFVAQALTGPWGVAKSLVKGALLDKTVGPFLNSYLEKAQTVAATTVTSLAHDADYFLADKALTEGQLKASGSDPSLDAEGRDAWGRMHRDMSSTQKGSLIAVEISATLLLGVAAKAIGAHRGRNPDAADYQPTRPSRQRYTEAENLTGRRTHESVDTYKQENEVAGLFAREGYHVEQNPVLTPAQRELFGIHDRNPDYLIEGRPFDLYSPTTSNVRSVHDFIQSKANPHPDKRQADRIIVDLRESKLTPRQLEDYVRENPIKGLNELRVVTKDWRGNEVIRTIRR